METFDVSMDVWNSLLQQRLLADHMYHGSIKDPLAKLLFKTMTSVDSPAEDAQAAFEVLAKCIASAGSKGAVTGCDE